MYPVVMEKSIPSYSGNTKFLPNIRTIEQNRMLSIKMELIQNAFEQGLIPGIVIVIYLIINKIIDITKEIL